MGSRDKSQAVGFVYTNIYQIYKNSQAAASKITSDSRVWRAEDLGDLKVTKFQPRTLARVVPVLATAEPSQRLSLNASDSQAVRGNPFDDLKGNLNKLQDLHSKLRFMLKELEDLVATKK